MGEHAKEPNQVHLVDELDSKSRVKQLLQQKGLVFNALIKHRSLSDNFYKGFERLFCDYPKDDEGGIDLKQCSKEQLIAYINFWQPFHNLNEEVADTFDCLGAIVWIADLKQCEHEIYNYAYAIDQGEMIVMGYLSSVHSDHDEEMDDLDAWLDDE